MRVICEKIFCEVIHFLSTRKKIFCEAIHSLSKISYYQVNDIQPISHNTQLKTTSEIDKLTYPFPFSRVLIMNLNILKKLSICIYILKIETCLLSGYVIK